MKVAPLAFLLAAAVMLPAHVGAQLAGTVEPPSRVLRTSPVAQMRPSMVARYATVPDGAAVAPITNSPRTRLVRPLLGAAVTMAAVLSRSHPLLPTSVRMVRHDH